MDSETDIQVDPDLVGYRTIVGSRHDHAVVHAAPSELGRLCWLMQVEGRAKGHFEGSSHGMHMPVGSGTEDRVYYRVVEALDRILIKGGRSIQTHWP